MKFKLIKNLKNKVVITAGKEELSGMSRISLEIEHISGCAGCVICLDINEVKHSDGNKTTLLE